MTPPHVPSSSPRSLSRRALLRSGGGTAAVLLGGGAGLLLGACGSSDSADDTSDVDLEPIDDSSRVLIQVFNPNGYVVSSLPQRMVFALGQPSGLPVSDGTPDALEFELHRLDGEERILLEGGPIEVLRHEDGVPIDYYPLRATFDEPGTYVATTTPPGAAPIEATFGVVGPAAIPLIQPGSKIPTVQTPTVADPMGVDICTADPECPLHDISLDAALGTGKPTVFLVSTPAFCAIGVCGPVLDLVLEQQAQHPDVQFIHCEVYADDKGASGGNLLPAVTAMGLSFEPSLFFVTRDGVVQSRLDNVFDRTEISEGLASLVIA